MPSVLLVSGLLDRGSSGGHGRVAIGALVVVALVVVGVVVRRRRTRQHGSSPVAAPEGLGLLGRIGHACARHGWLVLGCWIVVLVLAVAGHRALGGAYSDDFTLPASSAQQGANLLRAHEASAGGQTGQVVYSVTSGTLATHRSAIERAQQAVAVLPHVLSSTDPLSQVSKDGRTAYATVHFADNPQTYGTDYVGQVDAAVTAARADGVQVDYGAQLGVAARPRASDLRSEAVGIAAAIVVLLLGFGSVLAAGLPIVSALIAALTGLSILGMLAAAITFPSVTPTLAVMMGLGVSIDYALFLSTRHRQQVQDGVEPATAAARTNDASGSAVLVAAATVIVALLGLYASGLAFIGKMGLAAGIGVAVGAVAAVTLVPALLGLAGRRIDVARVRPPVAEPAPEQSGGWRGYARTVSRRPWLFLVAGVLLAGVLATPLAWIQLGHVDAGADPSSFTDRRAYDAIADGFGAGANGPITVVADLGAGGSGADEQRVSTALVSALRAVPDVASVSPPRPTSDGALVIATVIPASDPQSVATDGLLDTLEHATVPDALAGTDATGYVTGVLAAQLQFRDEVSARLPWIILTVVAASFVLLVLTFRAPVLAIKAAVMNLVSVAAAYGVVVAVFQWGWGAQLFGVGARTPIESYVPMMMFAIVFGLSMDYEVFLLSRVREAWLRSRDNTAAVIEGLSVTARVITCAALIMASVFLAFLASSNVVVKMFALGLGASILIDAFVIRLLLVPSLMFLLGHVNWWTPRWLDRALGRLTLLHE